MVVLPTPPEPQHTTMRVCGSSSSGSTSSTRRRRAGHAVSVVRSGPHRAWRRVRAHDIPCFRSSWPAVQARQVHALGEQRQFVQRAGPARASTARCSCSSATRSACSLGLRRAAGPPAARRAPPRRAPPSPAADSALATAVRGTLARRVPARPRPAAAGRTMLTMTAPTGSPAARSSAMPSAVSWTGISSSSVTRCTAVSGDFSTRITACAWLCIGPILARPATSSLTFRKRVMRPGGRGVHDHVVVDEPPALVLAAHRLARLAGQQHVPQARARWWSRSRSRRASSGPGRRCPACRTSGGSPAGPVRGRWPARTPPRRPGATAIFRSSYGSASVSKSCAMPCRPSTSTRRVRLPSVARASASAAATVVLPVPPLPLTTWSLLTSRA